MLTFATKTGDFENDVRDGYYRWERNHFKNSNNHTFYQDFDLWLIAQGVPAQYAAKVARFAYEHGHAHGEEEILNCAYGLVEIFKSE